MKQFSSALNLAILTYLMTRVPNGTSGRTLSHSKHPIVVIISFDRLGHDYLERDLTPTLKGIARSGSRASYMQNEFPTTSFLNHFSMATGMHPETHGVLAARIFDDDFRNCLPKGGYELFHYNDDIVPIWILNENTGDDRYSGVMMWASGEYKYQGKLPRFVQPFDMNMSWTRRVDTVIGWMTHSVTPANFVLMYFTEPNKIGHKYGPHSDEVNQTLSRIDRLMKYYLDRLTEVGIRNLVNTIVVSDHGMKEVNQHSILSLDDYLDPQTYLMCGKSPIYHIKPKPGFEDIVYQNLSAASRSTCTRKFDVYKKEDVPDKWYNKNCARFPDIFVECKSSYLFEDSKTNKGAHGYDNEDPIMRSIFMAQGPHIKRNYTVESIRAIDLYPLISCMEGLQPPPAHVSPNGTIDRIQEILVRPCKT